MRRRLVIGFLRACIVLLKAREDKFGRHLTEFNGGDDSLPFIHDHLTRLSRQIADLKERIMSGFATLTTSISNLASKSSTALAKVQTDVQGVGDDVKTIVAALKAGNPIDQQLTDLATKVDTVTAAFDPIVTSLDTLKQAADDAAASATSGSTGAGGGDPLPVG